MKTRNVLYIVPSANIGGAETFIQHCAKFHKKYKPVFALLRDGVLAEWLKTNNFEYHIAPHPPRIRNFISQMQCISWLKQLVKQYDINLIHSNMAYAALFGGTLSKLTNIAHLWFQHGPASGLIDSLAGHLPHKYLLVNSKYTLQSQLLLEKKFPQFLKPNRKTQLFQLGVDLDEIKNVEQNLNKEIEIKKLGLNPNIPIAGMVCRLQEWKGVHIFIQAIELAQKKRPIQGVVWGGLDSFTESQKYKKDLERQINDKKIPVTLCGPTMTPLKQYGLLDIVVNASITPEPFGLSIIEGMCMGAWPIMPDEGGPLEIYQNCKMGSLFKAKDASDLADKILNFEKADREKIKLKAHSLFNAQKSIEHLESIFDSILTTNNQK
ncbi:MAG: glycosyltransferase [Oligoflexia bacterium]|nr:glycosyltransferase [Oligoflexia bacterium]